MRADRISAQWGDVRFFHMHFRARFQACRDRVEKGSFSLYAPDPYVLRPANPSYLEPDRPHSTCRLRLASRFARRRSRLACPSAQVSLGDLTAVAKPRSRRTSLNFDWLGHAGRRLRLAPVCSCLPVGGAHRYGSTKPPSNPPFRLLPSSRSSAAPSSLGTVALAARSALGTRKAFGCDGLQVHIPLAERRFPPSA